MGRRKINREEIKNPKAVKTNDVNTKPKRRKVKTEVELEPSLVHDEKKTVNASKAKTKVQKANSKTVKVESKATEQTKNLKKNQKIQKNKAPKKEETVKEDNITIEDGIEILNNQKEKEKIERENRIKSNANSKKDNSEEAASYEINKPLIVIIILIIGIIIYLFFEIGPIFGISLNRTIDLSNEKSVDIITSSEDVYDEYMSEFLVYSNHKVCTYDSSSKKTWEYSLAEQFTPNIYIKDKFLAITNNSTGNIYLFENKKEILNMRVDGKISNLYFDKNGNFAVDYSTNEYKKVIGVYDKKGNLLYNTYPSAKSIINLELMDNASKVLIVETASNSFKVGVDIYIIDSNSDSNSTQKIASLDNCFAYDLTIVKDDIIILLDNEIIRCNMNTGNVNRVKTFDSNQMLFIGLSNNYYFSVEKELNDSESYNFDTKLFDNEDIGSMKLKVAPKTVKTSKLLNYIAYQNDIQVINKWGVEVKNILIDSNPKEIIPFGTKTIALVYTNKVYIVNL